MKAVGIIAEYNPFHNGHLHHMNEVKRLCKDDVVIVVLSGHFMQRGETSIINKWDKTIIALHYGADIVIELPFPFATQSADIFAKGSIEILKHMKANKLVFGSECNDIEKLKVLAKIQLNNKQYNQKIKQFLNEGVNYPTALSKSLYEITNKNIDTPNDILGISYIREIIKQKTNIQPICIKRTNNYHSLNLKGTIVSASSIREALKNKKNVKQQVPRETYSHLKNNLFFIDDYFPYLKYKILVSINNLDKYQTVDEGIENRIKKAIVESTSLEDLISKVKTKRYTYNKIRRMFAHILNGFTKEEAKQNKNINYLRILGFSKRGQSYLNKIKKDLEVPLITKYNRENDKALELEKRATSVYASILNEKEKNELIAREYKQSPIKINYT